MKENYLLLIRLENAHGIVNRITSILSRRRIGIDGLSMAKTDIHPIMMLTIEVNIESGEAGPLLRQLEKVIGVYGVQAINCKKTISHRTAFFKLSRDIMATPRAISIQKFGAQVIGIQKDTIVVSKSGTDAIIREFYNQLDGKDLLGFIQTGLIADPGLTDSNDEYRIIRLAA